MHRPLSTTVDHDFRPITNILGRAVTLDGQSYQIVGVMRAGFKFLSFPNETEIWLPFGADPFTDRRIARAVNAMGVIGRLKQGVALGQAQAETRTIARTLAEEQPVGYRSQTEGAGGLLSFVIRTTGAPTSLASAVRAAVAEVDCNHPV